MMNKDFRQREGNQENEIEHSWNGMEIKEQQM